MLTVAISSLTQLSYHDYFISDSKYLASLVGGILYILNTKWTTKNPWYLRILVIMKFN